MQFLKRSHLIDHLNLSEGQPVQPVNLHHVTLPVSLCQLGGVEEEDSREGKEEGRVL